MSEILDFKTQEFLEYHQKDLKMIQKVSILLMILTFVCGLVVGIGIGRI